MSAPVHVGISLILSVTGDLALADTLTSAADALTHVADALTQTLLPSDTNLTNPCHDSSIDLRAVTGR